MKFKNDKQRKAVMRNYSNPRRSSYALAVDRGLQAQTQYDKNQTNEYFKTGKNRSDLEGYDDKKGKKKTKTKQEKTKLTKFRDYNKKDVEINYFNETQLKKDTDAEYSNYSTVHPNSIHLENECKEDIDKYINKNHIRRTEGNLKEIRLYRIKNKDTGVETGKIIKVYEKGITIKPKKQKDIIKNHINKYFKNSSFPDGLVVEITPRTSQTMLGRYSYQLRRENIYGNLINANQNSKQEPLGGRIIIYTGRLKDRKIEQISTTIHELEHARRHKKGIHTRDIDKEEGSTSLSEINRLGKKQSVDIQDGKVGGYYKRFSPKDKQAVRHDINLISGSKNNTRDSEKLDKEINSKYDKTIIKDWNTRKSKDPDFQKRIEAKDRYFQTNTEFAHIITVDGANQKKVVKEFDKIDGKMKNEKMYEWHDGKLKQVKY